jgi:GT2 family glycosyltransferase
MVNRSGDSSKRAGFIEPTECLPVPQVPEAPQRTLGPIGAQETATARPSVRGKFFYLGEQKLYIRGVTYGPFHPEPNGCLYHQPDQVDADFSRMSANDINAVRTYTVPPTWLLDAARRHGLWVMVGVPWEQHIAFLDDKAVPGRIEESVRQAVRSCAGHPAILSFAIGNEIPPSIVRWHGRLKTEAFLRRIYAAAKSEDPQSLFTYMNFPPTEYLQLGFLDFACFNVYLEDETRLRSYLARLQNLVGDRPLLLGEVGLDSRRNSLAKQALALEWQIKSAFETGCSGAFVFSWTDEWSRGGFEITDWDFGLTTRIRSPKPALETVRNVYGSAPFAVNHPWPFVSVIICSYNGQRTLRETLTRVSQLHYVDYEVIVVNDGSTDTTASIASEFPQARLISVTNGGLSAARNIGSNAAEGEILAYIDDDAYPDKHWLQYLAHMFCRTEHAAVGGPNIPPVDDGFISACVASAPGGPIHSLLTDETAEHIPGCNFAVRKSELEAIGGFDPIFRTAGDDVDVCWRLQARGKTLGYAAAAVVWHHRRNSIRAYWRQQKEYGKAEALLERKWPEKYNRAGHITWFGRLYGPGVIRDRVRRSHVYLGVWGTALFQSLYEPGPGYLQLCTQTPEWFIFAIALFLFSGLGMLWPPLWIFAALGLGAIGLPLVQAFAAAASAQSTEAQRSGEQRSRAVLVTGLLFATQPLARLWGRLSSGLSPWRRTPAKLKTDSHGIRTLWSEQWRSPESWLESIEDVGRELMRVRRGGGFDAWDLQFIAGFAGSVLVLLAVEEHGSGKQLLRFRVTSKPTKFVAVPAGCSLLLALVAGITGHWSAAVVLGTIALGFVTWFARDCSAAKQAANYAIASLRSSTDEVAR